MKTLWNSFLVAFAMYSKIPMPRADWEEKNMRYSMCFFPVIGLVIGLLEGLWYFLCRLLGFGRLLGPAAAVLIPILVTGGIHFDGFLDTSDAMSSWREREDRLRILKDSHTGAFAIISGISWFLLDFGAAGEFYEKNVSIRILWIYALTFVISRSFSGLSVVTFKSANPKGTAAAFSENASKLRVRICMYLYLAVLFFLAVLLDPLTGILVIIASLIGFASYHHLCMKYFGGMTGDLAGFFVTVTELLMLLAVVAGITLNRFI
ncbi:MAG: adenosylcobinamide-GDP ribazoletransferase [Eubacterium sp.]|nr:adenosylcobinamide-GDP ribazoletransferase [Eubacterium sp.]